jgi:transcriptional regulator with XRE-family HTH domain
MPWHAMLPAMGQINPAALKAFRELRGLSQQTLAEAIGITPQQYNKIERGSRRASLGTIEALAAHLDVLPAALTKWCDMCVHLKAAS